MQSAKSAPFSPKGIFLKSRSLAQPGKMPLLNNARSSGQTRFRKEHKKGMADRAGFEPAMGF